MKELHSFMEIYFFGVLLTHIVISNQDNVGLNDSQQYHYAGSYRNITKVKNDKFKQMPLEWTHYPLSGVYISRKELSEPWYINSNSYIVQPRKGRQILYKEENIDMQYNINKFSQVASAHCPYADFCFINGSKINSKSTAMTSCCKACYCDNKCGERMDCCFDGLDQDKIVKTHQMVCVFPRIGGDTFWAESYRSFYMVVKCPNNSAFYSENKTSSPFDQLYPVYSPSADMIFLNREYAKCNGFFDSLNWTSYMTCQQNTWTFDNLSLKDLKLRNCKLTFFPPKDIDVDKFTCYYGLIDSCNVTGEWTDYDDDIRQACESIRAPVYFGKIYANVFCKLCNGKPHNPLKICDVDDWYESITRTSEKHFVALLNYQSILQSNKAMDGVLENKNCGKHEVLHPFKRECRKVLCPNSAVRTPEGCKTFLKTWQKEGYKVHVDLTPTSNDLIPVASLWNLARVQQRNHKLWFDSAGIPADHFALHAILVEQNNVSYVKRLGVLLGCRHGPVNANETLHIISLALSKKWILRLNKNKVYMYHAVFAKYKHIPSQSYPKLEDYQRRQNSSPEENVWLQIMTPSYFGTLSINKMHFCEQVELNPGEWKTLKINSEIKLNLTSASDEKILGNAEFNLINTSEGERVWICVEDFNKDYYKSRAYKPNPSFIFLTIVALLHSD